MCDYAERMSDWRKQKLLRQKQCKRVLRGPSAKCSALQEGDFSQSGISVDSIENRERPAEATSVLPKNTLNKDDRCFFSVGYGAEMKKKETRPTVPTAGLGIWRFI